jgi:pyruvate/2-oxoglutarate/acetoin dehydrogenase E1 component
MATVLESLNEALRSCLAESDQVLLLGEDILDPYGGAFKVTQGLSSGFPGRVVTTPVSEAGIVGVGVGMALRGMHPVVEIMFGDFLTLAADQLINHAAKMRWMSADRVRVPMVVRTPMGGRRGYGPTHSQTLEKHFLGVPGLRVLAIAALDDPGALLRQAVLEENDPILFIEHKLLYSQDVIRLGVDSEFAVEKSDQRFPSYRLRVAGAPDPALTLVAYGYGAHLAAQAVRLLAYEKERFAELIVPTQLSPYETSELEVSVTQTGRLLVVEEGSYTLGWGAEVVARLAEKAGTYARFARVAALDSPVPAAGALEDAVLPSVEDIVAHAGNMFV